VAGGTIVGDTAAAEPDTVSYLCTERSYRDFVLKVKFRLAEGNSGIQLRSKRQPDYTAAGVQAEIGWTTLADPNKTIGLHFQGVSRGPVWTDLDKLLQHFNEQGWNEYAITCQGRRIRFELNGYTTVDYLEDQPLTEEGVIGFQVICMPRIGLPRTRVVFKDIWIKELPASPGGDASTTAQPGSEMLLFNGRDLEGWVPVRLVGPKQDQHYPTLGGWAVRNGELVCVGDEPGWLRTNRTFDDFVLELEFKIPSQANSGVLIRCPGQGLIGVDDGMEIQISAVSTTRLPGRPLSASSTTGAIFGIVAPDADLQRGPDEWNKMKIRCEGDDIEIYMDGIRVLKTNMQQEERLRDRLRSGYIGLFNWSGRAKGTAFRNIRIREL